MYLSYSGFKTYMQCPRTYWHRYIDKTRLPKPENRVTSLYGSVIGAVVEVFYNDKMWRRGDAVPWLTGIVEETARSLMAKEVFRGGTYDWSDPKLKPDSRSLELVLSSVRESVPRAIEIIRQHRLLGTNAVAEYELDLVVDGHKLGGRADFVMRRIKPHGDLIILDGKGSKYRDKYTDVRQLYWYAMLYELGHKETPDTLGFVFWRSEPHKAVDWIPFERAEVVELRTAVFKAIGDIVEGTKRLNVLQNRAARDEAFPAQAGDRCKLCSYSEVCVEGSSYLAGAKSTTDAPGMGVEEVE